MALITSLTPCLVASKMARKENLDRKRSGKSNFLLLGFVYKWDRREHKQKFARGLIVAVFRANVHRKQKEDWGRRSRKRIYIYIYIY